MSYFPPEDVWLDAYGLFHGWPQDAEVKFKKNQTELESTHFQPKSRAVWKRQLRTSGSTKHIAERLERVSQVAIVEADQVFDHTL